MFEKIPFKGPILAYGAAAALLAGAGQWAKRAAGRLADVQTEGEPGIEDLGALAPLAGSTALLEETDLLEDGALAIQGADGAAEAEPAKPRVHAPFDGGSEFGGRHGPPARALPRSVTLVLQDSHGLPFDAESIEVEQGGEDGTWAIQAYRSSTLANEWIAGSPGITDGVPVTFLVRAQVGGKTWKGDAGFESTPAGTNLTVRPLTLERTN